MKKRCVLRTTTRHVLESGPRATRPPRRQTPPGARTAITAEAGAMCSTPEGGAAVTAGAGARYFITGAGLSTLRAHGQSPCLLLTLTIAIVA